MFGYSTRFECNRSEWPEGIFSWYVQTHWAVVLMSDAGSSPASWSRSLILSLSFPVLSTQPLWIKVAKSPKIIMILVQALNKSIWFLLIVFQFEIASIFRHHGYALGRKMKTTDQFQTILHKHTLLTHKFLIWCFLPLLWSKRLSHRHQFKIKRAHTHTHTDSGQNKGRHQRTISRAGQILLSCCESKNVLRKTNTALRAAVQHRHRQHWALAQLWDQFSHITE